MPRGAGGHDKKYVLYDNYFVFMVYCLVHYILSKCFATAATVPMRKDILILVWMSFEWYFEIEWEPEKEQNEAWTSRKSGKMASWEPLGRFLGSLARFGGNFWRSWGEDRRKMGEVGAKLAASRVQDGP